MQAILLEQAFGRYSFNQDFHLTFGTQVTVLGFDQTMDQRLCSNYLAYKGTAIESWKELCRWHAFKLQQRHVWFIFGLHDVWFEQTDQ